MKMHLADEAATQQFAAQLAAVSPGISLVTLSGDLGAGKTTLVREMLRAMGYQGRVKSPTFTLVEPYLVQGRRIYHFDLYRLVDPEELEYLGFTDYFEEDTFCLIEWPEKGRQWLPAADLAIILTHLSEDERALSLEAHTASGQKALAVLSQAVMELTEK